MKPYAVYKTILFHSFILESLTKEKTLKKCTLTPVKLKHKFGVNVHDYREYKSFWVNKRNNSSAGEQRNKYSLVFTLSFSILRV